MESIFNLLNVTEEEARQMDEETEQMLAAMRSANEKIEREQQEIEQLQAETRQIILQMKERQRAQATV
ncbi:MAG: hypothetical protein WKF30_12515 [Pyrinomonadaceae bacterium]